MQLRRAADLMHEAFCILAGSDESPPPAGLIHAKTTKPKKPKHSAIAAVPPAAPRHPPTPVASEGAGFSHTRLAIRAAVAAELQREPRQANKAIGDKCGCSESVVLRVRKQLGIPGPRELARQDREPASESASDDDEEPEPEPEPFVRKSSYAPNPPGTPRRRTTPAPEHHALPAAVVDELAASDPSLAAILAREKRERERRAAAVRSTWSEADEAKRRTGFTAEQALKVGQVVLSPMPDPREEYTSLSRDVFV
jgi:hypothetical protein